MVIAPLLLALIAWTFYKGCAPHRTLFPSTPTAWASEPPYRRVVGEYVCRNRHPTGTTVGFVRRPVNAALAAGLALGCGIFRAS